MKRVKIRINLLAPTQQHQHLLSQLLTSQQSLTLERNKPVEFNYTHKNGYTENFLLHLSHTLTSNLKTVFKPTETAFAIYDCDVSEQIRNTPCKALVQLDPVQSKLIIYPVTQLTPRDTVQIHQLIITYLYPLLEADGPKRIYPKLSRQNIYILENNLFQPPHSIHAIDNYDYLLYAMVEHSSLFKTRNRIKTLVELFYIDANNELFLIENFHKKLLKILLFENTDHRDFKIYHDRAQQEASLNQAMHKDTSKALMGINPKDGTLKSNFMQPYLPGEDLYTWIHMHRLATIPYPHKISILIQIVDQLLKLEALGWIYCDLKIDNILVKQNADGSYTVKLIDFGSVERLNATYTGRRGTLGYYSHNELNVPEQAEKIADSALHTYLVGLIFGIVLKEEENAFIGPQKNLSRQEKTDYAKYRNWPPEKQRRYHFDMADLFEHAPDIPEAHKNIIPFYLEKGMLNRDPARRPSLKKVRLFFVRLSEAWEAHNNLQSKKSNLTNSAKNSLQNCLQKLKESPLTPLRQLKKNTGTPLPIAPPPIAAAAIENTPERRRFPFMCCR